MVKLTRTFVQLLAALNVLACNKPTSFPTSTTAPSMVITSYESLQSMDRWVYRHRYDTTEECSRDRDTLRRQYLVQYVALQRRSAPMETNTWGILAEQDCRLLGQYVVCKVSVGEMKDTEDAKYPLEEVEGGDEGMGQTEETAGDGPVNTSEIKTVVAPMVPVDGRELQRWRLFLL